MNVFHALLTYVECLPSSSNSKTESPLLNSLARHATLALENRDKKIDKDDFEKFALDQINSWRDTILDWIILGKEVQVVYFEDFVQNKIEQMEKVFDFLKISKEKERMKCVKFATLDFYRRRNNFGKELKISKNLKKKILKIIKEVNKILKIFGYSSLPLSYLNI